MANAALSLLARLDAGDVKRKQANETPGGGRADANWQGKTQTYCEVRLAETTSLFGIPVSLWMGTAMADVTVDAARAVIRVDM
jgi:hypothetical protein